MALELIIVAAVKEENSELDDMTRRFWISTILAVPVFVIAMAADMWMGFAPQMISFTHLQLVEFCWRPRSCCWVAGLFSCAVGHP